MKFQIFKFITRKKSEEEIIKKEISISKSVILSIYSLKSGIGCSSLAKILAYFVKYKLEETVCIIDIKNERAGEEIDGIKVYKIESFYDVKDQYKYIILDMGFNDISLDNIFNVRIKLMASTLDFDYLRRLASFIEATENAKDWKYIFINAPSDKRKTVSVVSDLMEGYEYWCLPENEKNIFNKKNEDKIYRLLTGGKI